MFSLRYPWESEPWETGAEPAQAPLPDPAPKRRGRRPAARTDAAAAHWLYHHLTVTGPAGPLAVFAEAARGSGIIPWQIDAGRIEEDVFNLAVSQPPARRNLSVAGCRILARQFRERVELRQAQAAALVGHSRACPFDLQRLLAGAAGHSGAGVEPSRRAGLAHGALGHHRPSAPGGGAVATAEAASAAGPRRGRLRVLHRGRDAARGDRPARPRPAGSALHVAAATARLSHAGHGRHRG